MNCSLWRGCNVVVLPSFVPDVFCEVIEKYQIHVIHIVPPIANYLAKAADTKKYDFSSLKILHCAAAPLSAAQQKEVQMKFPHLIMKQGYGLVRKLCCFGFLLSSSIVMKCSVLYCTVLYYDSITNGQCMCMLLYCIVLCTNITHTE
jgi:non-ribosomal peptide synthetase component E (peptide arylation enzyme)